jgi:hypothetical protein
MSDFPLGVRLPDNGRVMVRAGLLALVLLASATRLASAQVMDPPVIVEAFERARNQRNVDAALAYFSDDAVVRLVERGTVSFNGKSEIRRFLQNIGTRTPPLLTSNRHVVGNTVTWNEREQGQLQSTIDLSVEAFVQEGKIKSLVYRAATPAAAPTRAEGPALVPAVFALGAVAGLGLILLGIASLAPRRRPSPSTLHGKLMSGLGEWGSAQR